MLPATQVRPRLDEPDSDRLRSRKKERTRLAIEDAALELFAEHGYEETTVEQIAARAEISKATFFRYFATKGDVIFGPEDDRHHDLQEAIIRRPPSEDPLTAVRSAIRHHWLPTIDPQRTVRQTSAARRSPLLRGLSLDLGVRWQEAVSEAVARRQGLPAPDRRCRLLAGVAFAVLSNAVNRWMDSDAASDLAVEVDEGFDLLVHLSADPDPHERRSPGNG